MLHKHPKLILILGATSVGKSTLGIAVAKRFNGEIISADSRQVYSGLNIGSGKITEKEMQGIPHHMLDVATCGEPFSVYKFETLALPVVESVLKRGKMPIVVGGTGFYINSIIFEGTYAKVERDDVFRQTLEQEKDTSVLYKVLLKIDRARAHAIGKKNRPRLIRALEINNARGNIPLQNQNLRYSFIGIGLTVPRHILNKKIEERVERRFEGIKREGKELLKCGVNAEWLKKLGLEYRAIVLLKDGEREEVVKKKLIQDIQRYGKRQITWFKKMEGVKWFSPTEQTEIYAYITSVLKDNASGSTRT